MPFWFLCSNFLSRTSHQIVSSCFLRLLWLSQVFSLSLFLMNWEVLRSKVFCNRMSLSWDILDIFLMIRLRSCIIREKNPEVKHHFHHVVSVGYTISMTYHCWCGPWSSGWGNVSQVLHGKVTSLFTFSIPHSWKEVLCVFYMQGVRSYAPLTWGWSNYIHYLKFFSMEYLFYSPLINYF